MLKKIPYQPITLAFAVNYPDARHKRQWALDNSHAVQYSPDLCCLEMLPERIEPFVECGIPVRVHARYFGCELGHADKDRADSALKVHEQTLVAVKGMAEPEITVHTGLTKGCPVKEEHIIDNLSRLAETADKLGMVVCLENLRKGHGADPFKILEWARISGARLTLDLGHAMGCAAVQSSLISMPDLVDLFASHLSEVHIYGKEDEHGHHPITDINILTETLDRLMHTDCRWWTIELGDPDEAMDTRDIIEAYLES